MKTNKIFMAAYRVCTVFVAIVMFAVLTAGTVDYIRARISDPVNGQILTYDSSRMIWSNVYAVGTAYETSSANADSLYFEDSAITEVTLTADVDLNIIYSEDSFYPSDSAVSMIVLLKQDSSGGHSVSFSDSIKFDFGFEPEIDKQASSTSMMQFIITPDCIYGTMTGNRFQ